MQAWCSPHMKTDTFARMFALVALAVASLWAAELLRPGVPAPDLRLKDQYDNEVRLEDCLGKATLLIYGDRAGSTYMGIWARAVGEAFPAEPNAVKLVRIANLKAVPPFYHNFAKRKFQAPDEDGKPRVPVLLDWEGIVAKRFGAMEDMTNVYLIDPAGILRYSAAGKATSEETQALVKAIKALDSKAP